GPLLEKVLSAGMLSRQTNRAALAQLIAQHPQVTDSEWEFQAAAAAAWFTDHERRLTLASLASWITRYLRQQRQFAEEESPREQLSEHRRSSRGGRSARRSPSQPGTVPHTPENDVLDLYEGPWESEEEWTRRLLVE